MPHIMYKNTSYGDSPHTQFMEITKAAYDALSAEEKAKDIVYIITDIDGELQTTAENVTYGESNVDATLDDMNDAISALQSVDTLPHISLTSEADLDDVTESGIYTYWQNQGHSAYAQNNSATGSGTLLVVNSGAFCNQVAFVSNTNIYVRQHNGLSWNEWREIKLSAIGADVQAITNATYLAGTIYARRNGNVITLSYTSDAKKVDAAQWVTLGTLEERFRPISTIHTLVRCGLAAVVWIRINQSSGIIEYYTSGSTASATNFQFNVTYIVNS